MDVRELAEALCRAGVEPDRYALLPLATPVNWKLRPEGSVWLSSGRGGWAVAGGGIAPHYDYEGTLRAFGTEDEACETFLHEMTGPGEPFAVERAWFSADCVRTWWEGEVQIALDEPEVAAERLRWRAVWREREAAGAPAMTVAELVPALLTAGFERTGLQLEGVDEPRPDDGRARRIGRDEQGRWFSGRWRPGGLTVEYRFGTEAELCRHFYDDSVGPVTMTPALTLAQWRMQRELAAEQIPD
jgi:hypothetical protein